MYKTILLVLALVIGLQYQSGAQEIANSTKRQHIIHLNNGSSIIGVLIQYGEEMPAIIEVADGERITVPRESIQSLQPIVQKATKSIIKRGKDAPYAFIEKGWRSGGSFGIISRGSSGINDGVPLSIEVNTTYHFSRLLGIGMSIGYDSYEDGGFQDFVPIQVLLTGYLSPTNTTLFYSLGAGYGIAVADTEINDWSSISNKGGLTLYPKIGFRLSANSGANATLFGGIKIQKSTLESRWGEELEESILQERTLKRLIIGIGLVF